MSVPPPLDLSLPKGHPGFRPYEPWPLGRFCSAYGGTPLLPGSYPTEEEYLKDKQSWAKAATEYLVKLQKWIDENTESQDPKIQRSIRHESSAIPPYRERIALYLT
jgi:hypothetical protein